MIINRNFKDFKFRHRSKENQIIYTSKKIKNDDEVLNLIDNFLDEKNIGDDRITGFHDIRVVNTDNHHVILFGMNVRLGLSQNQIVVCKEELNGLLKEKFSGYEINIKVSSSHQF